MRGEGSIWRVPNVNCVDSNGYTPLHHAALNGHSDVVELLLRNEALANVADSKGCYPLHLAAWKGDQYIVRLLIHQGPSYPKLNEQSSLDPREFKRSGPFDPYINAKNNDNETPLHCAAQYGHSEVVRLLLEELTDPTMRNNRFETPLDLAALYGRLDVVKLLLCAHPNLLSTNTRKHTPLHLASRNGHLPVVEVLLAAGMDINYEVKPAVAPRWLGGYAGRHACSVIFWFHLGWAQHLPPTLWTTNGWAQHLPPTLWTTNCVCVSGWAQHLPPTLWTTNCVCVSGWAQHLPPTLWTTNCVCTEKGSALHEAALFGKTDVVQKLLSAGINVNIVDSKNLTALDIAKEMPSQKSRQIAALIQAHMSGHAPNLALPPPPVPPPQENLSPRRKGEVEQQVCELMSGLAPVCVEESPYESLFEATSCHSLDSLGSSKSSDRDSGRPDSEAGRLISKDRRLPASRLVPGHEEELSSEAAHTSSSVNEDEDHTYETLHTAQTKHPDKDSNSKSSNSLLLQQRKATPPCDLRPPAPNTLKPPGPSVSTARPPAENSSSAQDLGAGVPEQFTGLLHGSSPVVDSREGEAPFTVPPSGVPSSRSSNTLRSKASVLSSSSSVAMASILQDPDPKAIYATVNKEARDSPVRDSVRARPPGDLKLLRSLSKSDSDLLVSPPADEEAGLANRSESVSNCSTTKRRLEKSPSFASEWDEIEKIMTLIGAGIDFSKDPESTTSGNTMPAVFGNLCKSGHVQYGPSGTQETLRTCVPQARSPIPHTDEALPNQISADKNRSRVWCPSWCREPSWLTGAKRGGTEEFCGIHLFASRCLTGEGGVGGERTDFQSAWSPFRAPCLRPSTVQP
ncbi:hypothetical protein P4O66_004548 [Electrophorus voltai]|uniref:Ankyrin repeat and sterile alpha motif domain containing 1A n=1 Tax=Electrophorus voltai TaxID=2609070 RepID=A0AAD9E449_9TELE|nr:hypothetical protein P4O66_004548 [Electrophorus voltai]